MKLTVNIRVSISVLCDSYSLCEIVKCNYSDRSEVRCDTRRITFAVMRDDAMKNVIATEPCDLNGEIRME